MADTELAKRGRAAFGAVVGLLGVIAWGVIWILRLRA